MRRFTTLLCAMLLAVPAASFGSVNDDQVTSQKIREADNTSAQNTNTGSGVKTGHIQNLAVTGAKIADGAVTDAKISGVVSVSKLPVGTAAGTVAAGNHEHQYANFLTVRENGSIQDAIDDCVNPGVDNRCLVKVMPGTYLVATPGLQMREYVDVQGSGESVTVIKAQLAALNNLWSGGQPPDQPATVRMASHSHLRDLSVINDVTGFPAPSGDYGALAIFFDDTVDAGADRISVLSRGPVQPRVTYNNDYHAVLVQGANASVALTSVTAGYEMTVPPAFPLQDMTGDNVAFGVWTGGNLLLKNCRAVAKNAWYNIGIASKGILQVEDSSVDVSGTAVESKGILNEGPSATVHGSTIRVDCVGTDTRGCTGVDASQDMQVHHSDITLLNPTAVPSHSVLIGQGKIAASGLYGILDPTSSAWTIFNCWNQDFQAVQ